MFSISPTSHTTATLQPLLSEEFDPKVFATSIIQCQMVGETLQKLTNGIATLDQELSSQVVTNYEDLVSLATGIEALESERHPLYLPSLVPRLPSFVVAAKIAGKPRTRLVLAHIVWIACGMDTYRGVDRSF